jgi:hypothetical protein
MAFHNPKKRSEEFLAEVRYKWRLNDLGQLVVNNKHHMSGEVGSVFTGSVNGFEGYSRVRVGGKLVQEHHIVWYLNTGEWPKQPLDHIDGGKLNNHPDNLRLSTHRENTRAYKKVKEGASSKYRGVSWYKRCGRWMVHIAVDGKSKHLGYFTCEKEAALVYNYAAIKHGYSPEAFNQVFAEDEVT